MDNLFGLTLTLTPPAPTKKNKGAFLSQVIQCKMLKEHAIFWSQITSTVVLATWPEDKKLTVFILTQGCHQLKTDNFTTNEGNLTSRCWTCFDFAAQRRLMTPPAWRRVVKMGVPFNPLYMCPVCPVFPEMYAAFPGVENPHPAPFTPPDSIE